MDFNKHKLIMHRILLDAFKDQELSHLIAFKGGTSLMFFHELPRFSVDLDFNILDVSQKDFVFQKIRNIALKYGAIADEKMKYFGPIVVLDYGKGETKLKLELSTRCYDNHYELKYTAGVGVKTMVKPDMFAHKLCALLDRDGITGRDVYDIHFFLKNQEAIHKEIVEQRMKKPLQEHIDNCIAALKSVSTKELMANVGEFLNASDKQSMRSGQLIEEAIENLETFKLFPLIAEYPQNKMQIEAVSIIKSKQGESLLSATIEGKRYMDKILTSHEKAQLEAYPEQVDKDNFLTALARSSYYDAYTKANKLRISSLRMK